MLASRPARPATAAATTATLGGGSDFAGPPVSYNLFPLPLFPPPQDAVLASHRHFRDLPSSSPFLDGEEGRPYAPAFSSLRLRHLVNHHMDMEMLLQDGIVPDRWLHPVYRAHWRTLLRVDQVIEGGGFPEKKIAT